MTDKINPLDEVMSILLEDVTDQGEREEMLQALAENALPAFADPGTGLWRPMHPHPKRKDELSVAAILDIGSGDAHIYCLPMREKDAAGDAVLYMRYRFVGRRMKVDARPDWESFRDLMVEDYEKVLGGDDVDEEEPDPLDEVVEDLADVGERMKTLVEMQRSFTAAVRGKIELLDRVVQMNLRNALALTQRAAARVLAAYCEEMESAEKEAAMASAKADVAQAETEPPPPPPAANGQPESTADSAI